MAHSQNSLGVCWSSVGAERTGPTPTPGRTGGDAGPGGSEAGEHGPEVAHGDLRA